MVFVSIAGPAAREHQPVCEACCASGPAFAERRGGRAAPRTKFNLDRPGFSE
jgi:hypothetical protein